MRINGERWSAGSFTPAVMGTTTYASLTTDAEGTLYYLFSGRVEDGWKVGWRTSRNWSETLRVSRDDTFNPAATPSIKYDPYRNLVLAFWKEQRWEESGFVPFFVSSANGWQPVRRRRHRRDRRRRSTHVITAQALTSSPKRATRSSAIRVPRGRALRRAWCQAAMAPSAWTRPQTRTAPYLVSRRSDSRIYVQRSSTGWAREHITDGMYPSIAVSGDGVVHVLRRRSKGP